MNYELVNNELGTELIKLTEKDGKIWWIPIDESNSGYQAYLKSLEEGTIS